MAISQSQRRRRKCLFLLSVLSISLSVAGEPPQRLEIDQEWRDRFVMKYDADWFRGYTENLARAQAAVRSAVDSGDQREELRATAWLMRSLDELTNLAHCDEYGRAVALARAGGASFERELFDLLVTSAWHWYDKPCPAKPSASEVSDLARRLGDPARLYYVELYRILTTPMDTNAQMEAFASSIRLSIAGFQRAFHMYLLGSAVRFNSASESQEKYWLDKARSEISDGDFAALVARIDVSAAGVAFRAGAPEAGIMYAQRALKPLRSGVVDPSSSASAFMDLARFMNQMDRPKDALALIDEADRYRKQGDGWLIRRARAMIGAYGLLGTPEAFAKGEAEAKRLMEVLAGIPDRRRTVDAYRAIVNFYEAFNRYEAASKVRSQVEAALDWQLRESRETVRIQVAEQLSVALKDQENARLKGEAELQAARRRGWTAAFVAAAAGVLASGAALAVAVRRGRRLSKLSVELAERNGDLEQRSAARIRLLAAACHDLRQPAHALGMLAELGHDTQREPARFAAWLQSIRRSTVSLSDMLDELMDLGRLDSGHYTPVLSAVCLDELFEELALHFRPLAMRKGLTLQLATLEKPIAVASDKHLLRRVVFNVVSNAIKYTDTGRVEVHIELQGGDVRLIVQDTGPGIPQDKLDDVFRDYVRLNPMKAAEGLGIGLSIVRRAAELLRHPLTLTSAAGEGTRVMLVLPRSTESAADTAGGSSRDDAGRPPGGVLALIENDLDVREAMTALLQRQNHVVYAGSDAAAVLAQVKMDGAIPAAVVTDLHLDGTDGLTEVARLRQALDAPRLPALLVTGDLDDEVAAQSSRARIHVVHKPLAPRKLVELVAQLIGNSSAAELRLSEPAEATAPAGPTQG